jgi:hypothetical protein
MHGLQALIRAAGLQGRAAKALQALGRAAGQQQLCRPCPGEPDFALFGAALCNPSSHWQPFIREGSYSNSAY